MRRAREPKPATQIDTENFLRALIQKDLDAQKKGVSTGKRGREEEEEGEHGSSGEAKDASEPPRKSAKQRRYEARGVHMRQLSLSERPKKE